MTGDDDGGRVSSSLAFVRFSCGHAAPSSHLSRRSALSCAEPCRPARMTLFGKADDCGAFERDLADAIVREPGRLRRNLDAQSRFGIVSSVAMSLSAISAMSPLEATGGYRPLPSAAAGKRRE